MNFPTFEQTLLTLLIYTRDVTKQNSDTYNTERAIRNLAKHFELTLEEREMEFTSGKMFRELITHARNHLRGARLIEGYNKAFEITPAGRLLLRKKPSIIDEKVLTEYTGYNAFLKELVADAKDNAKWYKDNNILNMQASLTLLKKSITDYNNKNSVKTVVKVSNKVAVGVAVVSKISKEKPQQLSIGYSLEDQISRLHQEHTSQLKKELLEKVKLMTPPMFEELSVSVLSKLIYPEAKYNPSILKDFGKTLGKTGDGGIDGIITKKDGLGRETKYFVQSKRWKSTTVGEPQLRDFVGALVKQKAKVGIFITTSSFTKAAEEYASDLDKFELKLIDGNEFVQHMIENEVGVQRLSNYKLRAIDQEYFASKSALRLSLF